MNNILFKIDVELRVGYERNVNRFFHFAYIE